MTRPLKYWDMRSLCSSEAKNKFQMSTFDYQL